MKPKYRYQILLIFCSLSLSCSTDSKKAKTKIAEPILLRGYNTFETEPYKAVVIKCDIGRLKLNVMPYASHKLEIHKSYQKYVHFDPRGDTLFIYTQNTPKKDSEIKVNKTINIYCPSLNYLESNSSKVLIKNFSESQLKVVNKGSSLRLTNSAIKDLEIVNKGLSNVYLSIDNVIESLHVKLNSKSQYHSRAIVTKTFSLEAKSLDNANFLNTRNNDFNWIRD